MAAPAAAAAAAAGPRLPTLYAAHGGGPLPLLGDPAHASLARWLKAWPKQALAAASPRALLVVSAHWEASGGWVPGVG